MGKQINEKHFRNRCLHLTPLLAAYQNVQFKRQTEAMSENWTFNQLFMTTPLNLKGAH